MIDDKQMGWLKEYLRGLSVTEEDRKSTQEIIDTLRKLWNVARASEQNPYPRSPRLDEALAAIKSSGPAKKS